MSSPRKSESIAPWISASAAAKLTFRPTRTIRDLAARGVVATFRAEGLRPLYASRDLARLIPPPAAPAGDD